MAFAALQRTGELSRFLVNFPTCLMVGVGVLVVVGRWKFQVNLRKNCRRAGL